VNLPPFVFTFARSVLLVIGAVIVCLFLGEANRQSSFPERVISWALSSDGQHLLRAGSHGLVVLHVRNRAGPRMLDTRPSGPAVFSRTSTQLASVVWDTREERSLAVIWDAASDTLQATLDVNPGWPIPIALSWDCKTLATVHGQRAVRTWDIANAQLLSEMELRRFGVEGLDFAPDGAILATAGSTLEPEQHVVLLWNWRSGQVVSKLGFSERGYARSVRFASDGGKLAVGLTDGTVRVWDIPSGGNRAVPCGGALAGIQSLVFSGDNTLLGMTDGASVVVSQITSRTEEPLLRVASDDRVAGLVFGSDDRNLFVVSNDGTVTSYDLSTGLAQSVAPPAIARRLPVPWTTLLVLAAWAVLWGIAEFVGRRSQSAHPTRRKDFGPLLVLFTLLWVLGGSLIVLGLDHAHSYAFLSLGFLPGHLLASIAIMVGIVLLPLFLKRMRFDIPSLCFSVATMVVQCMMNWSLCYELIDSV